MLKSDLVNRIAKRHDELQHSDVALAVRRILFELSGAIAEGRRIEIRGFGAFKLRYRPPRSLRNPRTGQSFQIGISVGVGFKASRDLRKNLAAHKVKSSIDSAALADHHDYMPVECLCEIPISGNIANT